MSDIVEDTEEREIVRRPGRAKNTYLGRLEALRGGLRIELERAAEAGDLDTMYRIMSPMSLLVLADVMLKGKSDSARVQAVNHLLDRALGKPVQTSVNVTGRLEGMSKKGMEALFKSKMRKLSDKDKQVLVKVLKGDG